MTQDTQDTQDIQTPTKEMTEYRVSIHNRFGKVESNDDEVDLFEKLQKLEEEKELNKKNSQKPKKPKKVTQQKAEQTVVIVTTAEKQSDAQKSAPTQPLTSDNATESKTVPPPKRGYREFRRGGVVKRPTFTKSSETRTDSTPINNNERPSKPFRGRGNGGFRGGRGTFRKESEPRVTENVLQNYALIKEDVPTSPDNQSKEVTSVVESPSKVNAATTTSDKPRMQRGVFRRGGFSVRREGIMKTTEESTDIISVNNDEKSTQTKPFRGNGGYRRDRGNFRRESEHRATENVLQNKPSNEEIVPISPETQTNEVNIVPESASKVDDGTATSERPRMNRGTFRRGGFSRQRGGIRNATTEGSENIPTTNDERPKQVRSFRGRGRGRGGFRKVTEGVNENTSQDNNPSVGPNANESAEMIPVDTNNDSEAALIRKRESRRGAFKNGVWTVRTDEGTNIVSTNVDESHKDNQPFRSRGRGNFRGGRGGVRRGPVSGDHRFVQHQDQVGEPSVHDSSLQNGENKFSNHSKFSNKKFEPREPKEKEFTLDQWKKMEESKRIKTTFDVRTANEGVENEKWKDMIERKKDEDVEEKIKRSKNVKKQETKLEFDYRFKSKTTRVSNSESTDNASVPNFSDLRNFPGLNNH